MNSPGEAEGQPNRARRQELAVLESRFRIAFDLLLEELKMGSAEWTHHAPHGTYKISLRGEPGVTNRRIVYIFSNTATRRESRLHIAEFAEEGRFMIVEAYDDADDAARARHELEQEPTYRKMVEPRAEDWTDAMAFLRMVSQSPHLATGGGAPPSHRQEELLGEFIRKLEALPEVAEPPYPVG